MGGWREGEGLQLEVALSPVFTNDFLLQAKLGVEIGWGDLHSTTMASHTTD